MSTNTILAVNSASISTNSSTSSNSKEIACKAIESSFNNTTATIEQKQQYAECIDMLYPLYSSNDILVVKVLVVLAFVSFIFGFIKGYKEYGFGLGMLVGVGLSLFIPLALVTVFVGIMFLFSW